jgi:hypothetical protein
VTKIAGPQGVNVILADRSTRSQWRARVDQTRVLAQLLAFQKNQRKMYLVFMSLMPYAQSSPGSQ